MKRIFITCPDCHLEPVIHKYYGGENFFVSSLGGVLQVSDFYLFDQLEFLINLHPIQEVILVQESNCRFIRSTLSGHDYSHTKAEMILMDYLYHFQQEIFTFSSHRLRRQEKLSELVLEEQIDSLLHAPCIRASKHLTVKGVVLNKQAHQMKEILVSNED